MLFGCEKAITFEANPFELPTYSITEKYQYVSMNFIGILVTTQAEVA
jgi:hypothetical protein